MAFKITVHAFKSAHSKHLNHVPFRLKCHSNPKLVHSIMPLSLPHSHFDLYFIDFHFLYIFFPCIFYSLFCFRTWLFPLSDLLLLLSLSHSAPFSGFGSVKNRRRFGLQATTGMCHSCIVSACEHTNIIGHGDDILLMAF